MKQKTILLLEDEEELLSTVEALLRDQGYCVETSITAEKALESIEQSLPDLILADIKLPGIDGFDFFKEIQKFEQFQKIPFVFLTAFNNLQAAQEAKRRGAAEYITKPFDFEYLIIRIRELVPP